MVMLILSSTDKDKVVVSLLVPALLPAIVSSAPVLLELVLSPDVVVVHALLILDLTTVSGSIPVIVMIATMLMLTLMLDFPPSKASEDLLNLSASLVPLTPRAPDLKPVSASSTLAVAQEAALSLALLLVASQLPAMLRVMSQFLVTLVSLTAPIQLNTVPLLVRRSVLVDAWAEVLAIPEFALATRAFPVRTVPLLLNQ